MDGKYHNTESIDTIPSDELLMLFEGRVYSPEELKFSANEIDMALKTKNMCGFCKGIERCFMPTRGWQVVYNDKDSEFYNYKYPCFRYRMCKYELEREQTKKVSPRQLKQTFATFETSRDTQVVYDTCQNYAKNFNRSTLKGLLLVGGYGSGKTHLATAIMHELAANNTPCVFINMAELINDLMASFKTKEPSVKYEAALTKRLVIIDDIGVERLRDWVREHIYTLTNTRYTKELPTILTTNLSIAALEEHIGEAATSRITEMCDIIKLTCGDYRRRKVSES